MGNDLKSYVQSLFAEQFGSALVGVEVRVLPHQAFVQIGVREISPEMETFKPGNGSRVCRTGPPGGGAGGIEHALSAGLTRMRC